MNRKTILLVDDEPELLQFYREMFADCPYDFVEASNGVEGFIEMNVKKFDLILTDISMPLVDGKMLIKEIIASHTNKETPIIVVSGYLNDDFKKSYSRNNHLHFFDKPVDYQVLFQKVSEVLA